MIALQIDPQQLKKLQQAIEGTPRKLKNEMKIAVNATASKARRIMAKQVSAEVKVPQKAVVAKIKIAKKASGESLYAEVVISPSARISLKEFGARQTKAGTTYQISRNGKRTTMPGAFMGPKPGVTAAKLRGHVFKREGKARKPIKKLHGPSPWGVFVKGDARPPSLEETRKELEKQINRRIQFINFKKSGA